VDALRHCAELQTVYLERNPCTPARRPAPLEPGRPHSAARRVTRRVPAMAPTAEVDCRDAARIGRLQRDPQYALALLALLPTITQVRPAVPATPRATPPAHAPRARARTQLDATMVTRAEAAAPA
jgi:hypothetical protein